MSASQEAIYEVVDISSEEIYYPLGVFSTLKEAKNRVINFNKYVAISPFTEYGDGDYEKIAIRKRPFGWSEDGTTLMVFRREIFYPEDSEIDPFWVLSVEFKKENNNGRSGAN